MPDKPPDRYRAQRAPAPDWRKPFAEGAPFTRAEMEQLVLLAERGIRELIGKQRAVLGV